MRTFTKLIAWLRRAYRPFRSSQFYFHAFGAPLAVATIVYIAFSIASDRQIFSDIADDALGRRMNLFADTKPAEPDARPLVLVDFDDRTSRALADPVQVPPAVLATVLARLAPTHPWAVIVDIDFADSAASADLRRIASALDSLSRKGTQVLLMREILPAAGPGQSRRLRPTPLDETVSTLPGVLWAASNYPKSHDGVVHEVAPFSKVQRGARLTLPSVPLALAVRNQQASAAAAKLSLQDAFARHSTDEGDLVVRGPARAFIVPRDPTLIDYSLRWPPDFSRQQRIGGRPHDRPLVVRLPMLSLLGDRPAAADLLSGAAVFVGASANERDRVQTPLGEMPGAFVLMNATHAWLESGVPSKGRFLPGLIVVLVYTVLLSLLAHALLHAIVVFAPARWRKHLSEQFPALLTALIWASFYFLGGLGPSIGLVVASYFVVLTVVFAHMRLHKQRRTNSNAGAAT